MGRLKLRTVANRTITYRRVVKIGSTPIAESIDDPENHMSIQHEEPVENFDDFSQINYGNNKTTFGVQTEIEKKDAWTQTSEYGNGSRLGIISKNFTIDTISNLICIFIDSITDFDSISLRVFSLIIYLLMRLFNLSYDYSRECLIKLRLLSIQQCHLWVNTIVEEDDLCVILKDNRGSYKRITFYEEFPELLEEAKSFALSEGCKKECTFNAQALSVFVDKRFREIFPEIELDSEELVRSVESCRVDLLKWGAKYDENKNRPYFEGHEREDVIEARKCFIEHMHEIKDFCYVPKKDNVYSWIQPMRKKKILISHDESTFRSGEVSRFRWIFPERAPFFNKGRGRSIMISLFMVSHNEFSIFELDEDEFKLAVETHPELNEVEQLNYFSRSANAWIEPRKDNYIDNEQILKQFERLFILLRFKKAFENHEVEIIVDNARTHSAKIYDVNMFNKFPGTSCIYNEIKWTEGDTIKR